jgi:hypothetical protein
MSTGAKPKRRRSPREKKKLSYERDRVNTYGQNDKASRKRIRKFKASSNRALRHKTRTLAALMAQADDPERTDTALADQGTFKGLKGRYRSRRKVPDFPLSLVLDGRPVRRIDGADRTPTRNVRKSVRAALQRLTSWEQRHDQQPQRAKRK